MPSFRPLILALLLTVPAAPVAAHPHAWIDLESRLIVDDEGRLEAVELTWLFDTFYTAFIAGEFVEAGLAPSDFLEDVAAENLANLREYDYFTDLEVDGEAVAFDEVRRFATGLEGERLWLEFEIPLASPVAVAGSRFMLAVYDPTYYVEILYKEGAMPVIDGFDAERCEHFVMPPTPTPEEVSRAFMLDMTETGENGLGRAFAERATIDCR